MLTCKKGFFVLKQIKIIIIIEKKYVSPIMSMGGRVGAITSTYSTKFKAVNTTTIIIIIIIDKMWQPVKHNRMI